MACPTTTADQHRRPLVWESAESGRRVEVARADSYLPGWWRVTDRRCHYGDGRWITEWPTWDAAVDAWIARMSVDW